MLSRRVYRALTDRGRHGRFIMSKRHTSPTFLIDLRHPENLQIYRSFTRHTFAYRDFIGRSREKLDYLYIENFFRALHEFVKEEKKYNADSTSRPDDLLKRTLGRTADSSYCFALPSRNRGYIAASYRARYSSPYLLTNDVVNSNYPEGLEGYYRAHSETVAS